MNSSLKTTGLHQKRFLKWSLWFLKWSFWPAAGFLLVGFFACQTTFFGQGPFGPWVVVFPTHDYTTYSMSGLEVYLFTFVFLHILVFSHFCFLFYFLFSIFFLHFISAAATCSVSCACNNVYRLDAVSLFTISYFYMYYKASNFLLQIKK